MSKKYRLENNEYEISLKSGDTLRISREKHAEILVDYTTRKRSVEEICMAHSISASAFDQYRRAMGINRDTIPISDEEISEMSDEELANLIVKRKARALDRAQDLYVQKVSEDAEKWRNFENGTLNPFNESIAKFSPKKHSIPKVENKKKNGRSFVVCLSDLQLGSQADGRSLFRQVDWNTTKASAALDALLKKIKEDVLNDKAGFENGVLILAGDLIHGLKGFTEKGTLLEVDVRDETQCDALFSVLYKFVSQLHALFGNLKIHSVKCNHAGSYHYPILMAIKNFYKDVKTIEVNIYSERTAVFFINSTLIFLDHGASDKYKADVPRDGKARESYIQSLILSKSEKYSKSTSCIFIQADKHNYQQSEHNDFEFIMLGALPMGDRYSDNLNLHSRARQNCMIIDETGLKSVSHYYIDQLV